jgi:hypothetical protein
VLVSVSVKVLLKGLRVPYVPVRVSVRMSVPEVDVRPLKGVESKVEVGRDTKEAEESDEQSLFVGEDGHDE